MLFYYNSSQNQGAWRHSSNFAKTPSGVSVCSFRNCSQTLSWLLRDSSDLVTTPKMRMRRLWWSRAKELVIKFELVQVCHHWACLSCNRHWSIRTMFPFQMICSAHRIRRQFWWMFLGTLCAGEHWCLVPEFVSIVLNNHFQYKVSRICRRTSTRHTNALPLIKHK
jgi:hypothetical protein